MSVTGQHGAYNGAKDVKKKSAHTLATSLLREFLLEVIKEIRVKVLTAQMSAVVFR